MNSIDLKMKSKKKYCKPRNIFNFVCPLIIYNIIKLLPLKKVLEVSIPPFVQLFLSIETDPIGRSGVPTNRYCIRKLCMCKSGLEYFSVI